MLTLSAVAMMVCFVPASLAASDGIAPPVAGRAPDYDEPPPRWPPAGKWVHLHWIPFDEARLQQLLKSDRTELWPLATPLVSFPDLAARVR